MISDAGSGLEDMELLAAYADHGCQESFAALVSRHIHWVHAMCLRGVRDRHMADDVAQAVFIILARKAKVIPRQTILRGWLFKTARFAVADALKKRNRHRKHEERAAELLPPKQATLEEQRVWAEMSPQLDEAVACLSDNDRLAVTLRFYEGKSLAEVGKLMGISEEAAKKRVARAVERLRMFFSREAVGGTTAVLLLALMLRTADASMAPAAQSIAAGAIGLKAPSGMALSYANGAGRAMLEAIGRLWAAIAASMLALGLLFWIISGATSGTAPSAVVVVEDHPAAVPYDRFAKIWLSTDTEVVWEYPPPPSEPQRQSQHAKLEVLQGRPLYAVARDHDGMLWIKNLEAKQLVGTLLDESLVALPYRSTGKVKLPGTEQVLGVLLSDAPPVGGQARLAPMPSQLTQAAPPAAPKFAHAPWRVAPSRSGGGAAETAVAQAAAPQQIKPEQPSVPKTEIKPPVQQLEQEKPIIVTPWRPLIPVMPLRGGDSSSEAEGFIFDSIPLSDPMDLNYQLEKLGTPLQIHADGTNRWSAIYNASVAGEMNAVFSTSGVSALIEVPYADSTRVPEPGTAAGLLGAALLMLRRRRR